MKKQIISMKRGAQKGFTLIELMIVVAIIGILAAFAVPMFQDYTVRTRVGEGLVLASTYKNLVVDNAVNGFDLGNGAPDFKKTTNTEKIEVKSGGVIEITSSSKGNNIVLELTPKSYYDGGTAEEALRVPAAGAAAEIPVGRISWTCKAQVPATGSTVQPNQIPSECR